MNAEDPSRPHPYSGLTTTPQWAVIDRAVLELAENQDLVETTAHEYIVGYLCKALAEGTASDIEPASATNEVGSRHKALHRLRKTVRQANPAGRDLVRELIEERLAEAQSE